VTGSAQFSVDLTRPGMLHVGLVRSAFPHARIVRIDVTSARKAPGVVDVITGCDFPDTRIGYCVQDRQPLAVEKVRSMSDMVAAVAAETPQAAEHAARLIVVDYEELPGVYSPAEAMAPDAPLVHENKSTYSYRDFLAPFFVAEPSNESAHLRLRRGDVAEARRRADAVASGHFSTSRQEHCSMEPHAAVAEPGDNGRVVIWCSTGKPFRTRLQVALALGTEPEDVHLIQPPTGGDFGGKGEATVEPICALLAQRTKRPVRAAFTREDEFVLSTARIPFEIDLEIGADRDGRLCFVDADVWTDAGPYNGIAGQVTTLACVMLPGPYDVEAIRVDGRCIYTNNPLTGSFRGFGNPQVTFAREQLLDELARQLGLDSLDVRMQNAWRSGSVTATGQWLDPNIFGVGVLTCLERVAEARRALERAPAPHLRRGWGIAAAQHGMGGGIFAGEDHSTTTIELGRDGNVTAACGASDVGQGCDTALAQVVAHELGLPLERVVFRPKDTDLVPWEGGASASRIMYLSGNSAGGAATALREKLFDIAADFLETSPPDLRCGAGVVRVVGSPQACVSFEKLAAIALERDGALPSGASTFTRPAVQLDGDGQGSPFPAFDFGAQLAEVEVDLRTGMISVLRLVAADDVGRAINPSIVEGQVEGAVVQGLGLALLEEMELSQGRVLTPSFAEYRLPRAPDLPPIESRIVEEPQHDNRYGAKGAGETGVICVAASIANAITDAVGVRVGRLPITPEHLLDALRAAERAYADS
jgi:CO/xanthine dehydrogenase Mo-binding subunit